MLVISEILWRRQFGADAGIVGRVVNLNRHSFTIIGVVPAAFHGTMTPSVFSFWAPLSMGYEVRSQARSTTKRDVRGWHDFARLRPGISVAQAQAAVAALDRNLTATYPETNRDIHHRVLSYSQCPWGSQSLMGPVLGLLLTLTTGFAFGLLPAWQTTRVDLNAALKQSGRSSAAGAAQHRVRSGLVIIEVALALVLLISAGLCLKGLDKAQQVDIGLDPSRVLLGRLQIGMNGYIPETGKLFYHDFRQRLAALPGVEEAALASWFPLGLSGCKGWNAYVEGYQRPQGEDLTYEYAIVSPRYFATLAIPLLAGRDFTDADDAGAPTVAIVNEAFARRFWPGQDPLGRRFRTGSIWRTIVGVAKTGRYNQLNEPAQCFFYVPYLQGVPDLDLNVCLRTTGDPAAFANTLTRTVQELDPGVDLLRVLPMTETILASFTQRMAAGLLLFLGTVALVLAAMGVYAVMAYSVGQRTQEFGVRIALGAMPADVLRQVLRQGLTLAVAGVAVGLMLALGGTRLLAGFLYGVSPFDPVTFVGVPLLLVAVVLFACYVPARRATRINPIEALRAE